MNHMIPRRELDACKARLEDVFYGHYEAPGTSLLLAGRLLQRHSRSRAHTGVGSRMRQISTSLSGASELTP